MRKEALFVIPDQYAELEAVYLASALHLLSEGQNTVKTVSLIDTDLLWKPHKTSYRFRKRW